MWVGLQSKSMGAGVYIVAVVRQTEILGIKVKALYCCIAVIELAFILSWLAFFWGEGWGGQQEMTRKILYFSLTSMNE